MAKSKNPDPSQFPDPQHRTNILLEEMLDKFRNFGEGLADVQEKVSKIPEILDRLERVESDVAVMKAVTAVIPTLASKKDLEPLATKKDLEKFEKRLTSLETR